MGNILDDVVIYGVNNIMIILWFLLEHGLCPSSIVDYSSSGEKDIEGIPIITKQEFLDSYHGQTVIIADEKNASDIITFLSTNGITQIITFSELDSFGKDNDYKRNNWVKEQLSKLPSGFRLLDAGAGECQYKKYCSHLNYVSQDFCEYDGSGNNGLQTGQWNTTHIDIVSDITSIPEEDSSFDAILCTEVFEHLENPEMAIKEFSRLLKRGGILIATAPFCSLTHFAPYHFATGFNVFWYQRILSKYDFEITCCEANGNYYSYLAQELRRIPYVASRYSGQSISISEEINIRKVIALLEKLDKSDTNSSELLCFGYHVVAQKV